MKIQKLTLISFIIALLSACSGSPEPKNATVVPGSSTGERIINDSNNSASNNTQGANTGTLGQGGASNSSSSSQQGNTSGGSNFNYERANANYQNGQRTNANQNGGTGNQYGAQNNGYNNQNNDSDISLSALNDPNNLLSERIIYFDYNQSNIRPEYKIILATHAKLLAKNPNQQLRLEGHADERGSRGYNTALSEARAQSIKRIMLAHGARSSQVTTIGFGEEMPVVQGHTPTAWQKNRRVEIKYKNY